MAHRPTVKQPRPLSSNPVAVERMPEQGNATAQVLDSLQSEISAEAAPLWNFVTKHARTIAAAILAIVLLIVGIALWKWYEESSTESARQELGRIVSRQDLNARIADLESFSVAAPKDLRLAANMELAAAAGQLEQWEKAADAYQRVIDQDKDSALAFTARLNRMDVLLHGGKYEQALTELEALLPGNDDAMAILFHQQIAEAAELAGHPQRAIQAYEAILELIGQDSPEESAFYRALIARLQ